MATIGMDMLYYAKITEGTNGEETYGSPIRLARAIQADLTIEFAEATLFADDGAVYVIKDFKTGKLTLGIDDIGVTAAQDLTGASVDDNGVLVSTSESDGAPVAIGFRALKPNGKYRYFWLYRVKFGTPATNLHTKGDTITFQTPTIEGVVIRRSKPDSQGKHPWKVEVTEGDDGVTPSVISGWYTTVYEPVFGAEPTKSPVVAADAVAGSESTGPDGANPVSGSEPKSVTEPINPAQVSFDDIVPATPSDPVTRAFEVMAKMGLEENVMYMFDSDRATLYIRLSDAYKQYIPYCTGNDIPFTNLTYSEFLQEFKTRDFFIGGEKKSWPDGVTRSVWVIDFKKLSEECDVAGFVHDTGVPVTEVES